MANNNQIEIIGNVTRDPELRFTASGDAVCSFSVAWSQRRRNPQTGDWEDGDTSFFDCTAWRQLGENVAASISKGDRVIVSGYMKQRSYEDRDGNKRYAWDIQVDEVGPSLRWATAQIERTSRSSGGGGYQGGSNQGGGGGYQGGGGNADPVYGDEEPF